MIIFVETHKTTTDMRRIVTVATALLCSLFAAGLSAQTTLVKKSKAKAAIVLVDEDARTKQAAELLQDFVKRISGAELPVTDQKTSAKTDSASTRKTATFTSRPEETREPSMA